MVINAATYDFADIADSYRFAELVGPVGKWRETRDVQVGMLDRLGLAPRHRFLDAGCGSLRLGLPIIGYLEPGNYVGFDIDPDCIAAAHELIDAFELAQSKRPTVLLSQDFGTDVLDPSARFDITWCFQVFIHLQAAIADRALAAIAGFLAAEGCAFITVKAHDDDIGVKQIGGWRSFPMMTVNLNDFHQRCRRAGLAMEPLGRLGDFGLPASRGGSDNLLLKLTMDEV